MWAADVAAGKVMLRRDECTIEIEEARVGAEALAECDVHFKLRPGFRFQVLRHGVVARHGDQPEAVTNLPRCDG